jgi:hypothetical protein
VQPLHRKNSIPYGIKMADLNDPVKDLVLCTNCGFLHCEKFVEVKTNRFCCSCYHGEAKQNYCDHCAVAFFVGNPDTLPSSSTGTPKIKNTEKAGERN